MQSALGERQHKKSNTEGDCCFSHPWRAFFLISCSRPEYFDWCRRGYTATLAFPADGQWGSGQVKNQVDTGKKAQDVFLHLLKKGKANFCHKGWKKSHFWEHTVCYLLDSLFIWLFNSVHDFSHVFRCLVLIFSQLTNCLKVWVFWSNI